MKFTDAAANCKAKFNHSGRLFEPREKLQDALVIGQAQKIHSNEAHWIGIRTQVHVFNHKKSDFYYLSEHPFTPLIYNGWATSEPNNFDGKEDCVNVLKHNDKKWADDECDTPAYSICELNKIGKKIFGWLSRTWILRSSNGSGAVQRLLI